MTTLEMRARVDKIRTLPQGQPRVLLEYSLMLDVMRMVGFGSMPYAAAKLLCAEATRLAEK